MKQGWDFSFFKNTFSYWTTRLNNYTRKKKKRKICFTPSYKCVENQGPLQPGCHSLLRPELLTQYRTVISTICRSDCLYFPALTWIQRFPTRLNAPSCSPPKPEHPPHTHRTVRLRLPLRDARSPCILKIAATCPRGPRVQTPRENNTIIFN